MCKQCRLPNFCHLTTDICKRITRSLRLNRMFNRGHFLGSLQHHRPHPNGRSRSKRRERLRSSNSVWCIKLLF
jgi:hypothetical protein